MTMLDEVAEGRPEGHRRVVHAGQHGGPPRPAGRGDRLFQTRARAEAGRRGSGHQPGARVPEDRRDDDALVGFRRFLELDPKNAQVHYEIAQILIDRGDLSRPRPELQAGAAGRADMAAARNALGVVALNAGELPSAERQIRQALDMKPDVRLAHFNLALSRRSATIRAARMAEYRAGARAASRAATRRRSTSGSLHAHSGDRAAEEAAYRQGDRGQPASSARATSIWRSCCSTAGSGSTKPSRSRRRDSKSDPTSAYAPLGHYVLADLYSRLGRHADAAAEAQRGRALEARPHPSKVAGG